jgi:hypothetical protein
MTKPQIEEATLDEARDFRPEGFESLSGDEGQHTPTKEG